MDTKTILSHVDHTLLKPEATWEQIKTLCDDGHGVRLRHRVHPRLPM